MRAAEFVAETTQLHRSNSRNDPDLAYASLTTARFSSMLKILPITLLPEPFLEVYGLRATWSCQRDVPSVPIVCSGSLRAIGRH
jgi:hypothetical protein